MKAQPHLSLVLATLGLYGAPVLFVALLLGRFFSDRVQALSDLLGDLTWAVLALVVTVVLGVLLFRRLREPDTK